MTYEDIQKANATIKPTTIKGKKYAEVNQRIKAFRMLYPQGFIESEVISHEDGVILMQAKVGYYENGQKIVLGDGWAQEKEMDKSSMVNRTSYVENCQTSAIGRALGMIGLGIDVSIASAEEVDMAIETQEKLATFDQLAIIKANIPQDKIERQLNKWGIRRFEDMTKDFAQEIIDKIENARKPIIQED